MERAPLRLFCVTVAWLPLLATAVRAQQKDVNGALRVVATLPADTGRTPLTGLTLLLVRAADTTQRALFSTRHDGHALVFVPAGDYRLRSLASARLGEAEVAWDVPVSVLHDRFRRIELTEHNGTASDSVGGAREAERATLERMSRSTVRLVAGVTKGTGVYIDTLGGLVVATTDFLGEARVVAALGPDSAVSVQEIARDTVVGLALLRLPTAACSDCRPLRVRDAGAARPGDPITVVARPPHQNAVVVTGRVTAAGADTLATSVAPTPYVAGGAVVDTGGGLVAVLTCLCGLGVRGDEERGRVIPSGRLGPLLARAVQSYTALPAPTADPAHVIPVASPAMQAVQRVADTATFKAYERFTGQEAGNFRISLITPAYLFARLRAANERNEKSSAWHALSEEEQVGRSSGYAQDWIAAFGDLTVPAVALDITPDAGQGSGLLRALVPGRTANVRFKAVLERAEIFRNGVRYEPIAFARLRLRIDFEVVGPGGQTAKMHDATHWGYYLLPPEVLMPDSLGAPPSIVLRLLDERRPGEAAVYELRPEVLARAWNDFAPYYRATRPTEPFRPADRKNFRSRVGEFR